MKKYDCPVDPPCYTAKASASYQSLARNSILAEAGDTVQIQDSQGNVLISYQEHTKNGQIVLLAPNVKKNLQQLIGEYIIIQMNRGGLNYAYSTLLEA
jgi:hypothetical protein